MTDRQQRLLATYKSAKRLLADIEDDLRSAGPGEVQAKHREDHATVQRLVASVANDLRALGVDPERKENEHGD